MNKEPIEDCIKYVEENAKRVNELVRKEKMTKVNQQTMKTQYDGQYDTFCRKNHDYGNSFEESLDQFGIVASIVRMSDKMKRLESLTDESKKQQVGSESLLDTLEDLSNYAAMTACWLRGIREEDGDKDTVYAGDIPPRPMEIPEAVKQLWEAQKKQVDYLFDANNDKEDEKVDSFNPEFLNMAKTCLNDLFDNIILCRDQNIPLPKRLTYCSYREEKYEQIAALVLTGNIDYSDIARIVNDYPNLRVYEKNHLLESIVASAYKISDESEDEKPEFLNKKFHIPDEILEDLKEPEEEPERKRTVLGMIFPFRL